MRKGASGAEWGSEDKPVNPKKRGFPRFSLRRLLHPNPLIARRILSVAAPQQCTGQSGIGVSNHAGENTTDTKVNLEVRLSEDQVSNKTTVTTNPTRSDGLIECSLCLSEFAPEYFPQLVTCPHRSCYDCFQIYLKIEISESRVSVSCPQCSEPMHPNDIRMILNDKVQFEKYEDFMVRRVLAVDPDTRWCPAPDCSYAVVAAGCASCPKIKCGRPGCGSYFCYHCKAAWHPNQTCDAARAQRSPNVRSSSLSFSQDSQHREVLKPCPRCQALIMKMEDGSCNHMICALCGAEFCWLCMKEVSDLHYLSPSGCTFWGKKPWSRKKKILWQLGTLVGAPVGIGLVAGIAVPAIIIGIPVWVGRKLYARYEHSNKHKRNLAIAGGVSASALSTELKKMGTKGVLKPIRCDIRREQDIKTAFGIVEKTLGIPQIVINNAAFLEAMLLTDADLEKFRQMYDTNVFGLVAVTKEAVGLMKKHKIDDGIVININSVAGHIPDVFFGNVGYATTKVAALAISQSLRNELILLGTHIRVTTISPGAVRTDMLNVGAGGNLDVKQVPALEPQDVVDCLLFVLSTPSRVNVLISPILASLAVGIGVPILLFYVYGVVPVSLCRSGGCGVSTSATGVRFDFDDENDVMVLASKTGEPDTVSHPGGNPSIGEASLSLGSGSHLERDGDRESGSFVALAGSIASNTIAQRLEVLADVVASQRFSVSSETASAVTSLSDKSVADDGGASTRGLAGSFLNYKMDNGSLTNFRGTSNDSSTCNEAAASGDNTSQWSAEPISISSLEELTSGTFKKPSRKSKFREDCEESSSERVRFDTHVSFMDPEVTQKRHSSRKDVPSTSKQEFETCSVASGSERYDDVTSKSNASSISIKIDNDNISLLETSDSVSSLEEVTNSLLKKCSRKSKGLKDDTEDCPSDRVRFDNHISYIEREPHSRSVSTLRSLFFQSGGGVSSASQSSSVTCDARSSPPTDGNSGLSATPLPPIPEFIHPDSVTITMP